MYESVKYMYVECGFYKLWAVSRVGVPLFTLKLRARVLQTTVRVTASDSSFWRSRYYERLPTERL